MSTKTTNNASTDTELPCPVSGCGYAGSVQQIAGHVGNGHRDGWNATDVEPWELHLEATLTDPGASARRSKVVAWLERNGVDMSEVAVYEHRGYGNIQVRVTGWIDDFDRYESLMRENDGIRFTGSVNWLTEEFVDDLPHPATDGGATTDTAAGGRTPPCSASGCRRRRTTRRVHAPVRRVSRRLCRYHRKQYLRVSS